MKHIKTSALIALTMTMIITATGCGAAGNGGSSNTAEPKRKIIIDTDTGADDSAAIIYAARRRDIDILGVTTLVGNVDMEQSNSAITLRL